MQFTNAISASLLVVVLATMASASTVVDVKKNIVTIDDAIVNLYQHLQVENPNPFTAFAAHQASNRLVDDIKTGSQCISQLTEKPTDADAKLMLTTLGKTETKVKAVVARMISQKDKVAKMGGLKLATATVLEFQSQVKSFSEQLIKLAPAQEQAAAQQLGARFNNDLAQCADVYTGKTSTEAAAGTAGSEAGAGAGATEAAGAAGKAGMKATTGTAAQQA